MRQQRVRQPKIRRQVLRRLGQVADAYDMPAATILHHILSEGLDELEGQEDDRTVVVPTKLSGPKAPEDQRLDSSPAT